MNKKARTVKKRFTMIKIHSYLSIYLAWNPQKNMITSANFHEKKMFADRARNRVYNGDGREALWKHSF